MIMSQISTSVTVGQIVGVPLFGLCSLVSQRHVNTLSSVIQNSQIKEEANETKNNHNHGPLHISILRRFDGLDEHSDDEGYHNDDTIEHFQTVLEECLTPSKQPRWDKEKESSSS